MIQNTFQRFISLLLSLTMLMSLASTAFAVDTGADTPADFTGADIESVVSVNATLSEEEVAKNLFESLSEEAKQIFLAQIATDPELTEFHRENVDPSFDPQAIPVTYANSEVDRVRSGLANLGLSSTATYTFVGAASAIAAGAGGAAITATEVYTLLFGTSIVTSIVACWEEVENLFSSIVGVFRDAFSYMPSAVSNALWDTRDDAASVYYSSPVTSIRYTTYTTSVYVPRVVVRHADGTEDEYICKTVADVAQIKTNSFYVAALLQDNIGTQLWVCSVPIDYATALAIRYANHGRVGIMTRDRALAEHLARQAAPGKLVNVEHHLNDDHIDNFNYFPHYHPYNSDGYTDGQIHIWHCR